jgi:nicotinate-nucleotide adenylyltransferase
MVELAVEKIPDFEVSDIEIRLKGTSYSINTIKELKKIYGSAQDIFFIAGSDYAEELKAWKDIEELKRLCNFVMATRPGYDLKTPPEDTRIISVDTPDISSTDIRSLIKEGKEFREFMPLEVYDYIVAGQLYL